ncbi:hypothetical protein Nmel_008486 [Mimus melanotis]
MKCENLLEQHRCTESFTTAAGRK